MQDAFMIHWRRLNDRLRALALRKSRKSSIDARGLVMLRKPLSRRVRISFREMRRVHEFAFFTVALRNASLTPF